VDIVGVCDQHAPLAKEGLNEAENWVEAEGEKLGTERTPLPCAGPAEDDFRFEVIASDVELRGLAVVRPHPAPKAREAFGYYLQESASVDGVECILRVQGDVHP